MKKKTLCIIVGTRPEIIKFHIIAKLIKKKKKFNCIVLNTNQHKDISGCFSKIFNLKFDYSIKRTVHKKLSFEYVDKISDFLKKNGIEAVMVMGDTLTGVTGAIAAYLNHAKIFYLESGLRTGDFNHPWPEEGFRKMMSHISNIHFAPTIQNKKNLINEGIKSNNIFVTGNPVIDSVKNGLNYINKEKIKKSLDASIFKDFKLRPEHFVLVTVHRRENFGKPFQKICQNINKISKIYKDLKFIYPVHPNPYITKNANLFLKKNKNVHLIKPVSYFKFLRLMQLSKFIISDSGGVQEECTILNKYVLLVREKTERPEIENKLVFITGSDYSKFKKNFFFALSNKPSKKYSKIFGDGNSAKKISEIVSIKM